MHPLANLTLINDFEIHPHNLAPRLEISGECTKMDDWNIYQSARKRAEGKLVFYAHVIVFVIVSTFFIYHNINRAPQYPWVHWPLIAWSIGICFHAMIVFLFRGNSFVTAKMIERELKLSKADYARLRESIGTEPVPEREP